MSWKKHLFNTRYVQARNPKAALVAILRTDFDISTGLPTNVEIVRCYAPNDPNDEPPDPDTLHELYPAPYPAISLFNLFHIERIDPPVPLVERASELGLSYLPIDPREPYSRPANSTSRIKLVNNNSEQPNPDLICNYCNQPKGAHLATCPVLTEGPDELEEPIYRRRGEEID